MKSYPETDFYLINYFPGSSGTFLQNLMVLLFYGDINYNTHTLTGTGNAVDSINPKFFNQMFDINGSDKRPIYQNILNVCPINKSKPVFSRSHDIPDMDILRLKFPCKLS